MRAMKVKAAAAEGDSRLRLSGRWDQAATFSTTE
ncbi:hypothetical protein NRB20_30530 [Nocardia sp. RB20]|uniref:Uncharacterized protein n=1 Tax=Nocardia macrotermitis TaxID=2585198 RepID=A0A7K0D2M4_9NOCA|nr:hypothetical protein [Nocardia macrotermitis]